MWNRKLCLGTSGQYRISVPEQILLFKKVGYDAFFTEWKQDSPISEWARIAKNNTMIYQSIHAPFSKTDDMWAEDNQLGDIALEELMNCLMCCEKNEVPIMVSHAFIGFEDHTPTEIGLERFYKLIRYAEGTGVKIAFENTEGEEYLNALLENFGGSKAVGFCWDAGHEMCYNHSVDLLARYGNILVCTHLNDNLGIRDYDGKIAYIDDLHLLPFDGIADWDDIAARLNKCGFSDMLTFELNTLSKPGRHENDMYAKMPIEDYITQTYIRACRVAAKLMR